MKKISAAILSLSLLAILPLSAGAQTNPTITSISPTAITTGSSDTTITVNGTNFASNSTVKMDGDDLDTTYDSATRLTATIPSSELSSPGTKSITVQNGEGATSSPMVLSVYTAGLPDTGIDPEEEAGLNMIALFAAVLGAGFLSAMAFRMKKVLIKK